MNEKLTEIMHFYKELEEQSQELLAWQKVWDNFSVEQ